MKGTFHTHNIIERRVYRRCGVCGRVLHSQESRIRRLCAFCDGGDGEGALQATPPLTPQA